MNKKAFSLIEVIVATSILSIAVFWVYKMIGENSKIVINSNNYLNTSLLFPIIETCIDSSWITTSKYIDLWSDYKSCTYSDSNIVNKIENIDYILFADMKNILSKSIVWEISVSSDYTATSTWIYIQKK